MSKRIIPYANRKSLVITGHLFCLIWIVFCCWYYKERTIYIDSASQIFEMLNSGSFSIFVNRYSMIFNELLPLAAIKAGAGLHTVLFAYAVSFSLIMYAIYCINVHYLRVLPAGLIILFMPASLSHTFFHAISETVQLIVYASLLYGWLSFLVERNFKMSKVLVIGVSIFLVLLNFFMHPVSAFFIVFILGFVYLEQKLYRHWYIYTLGGIFIVLLLLKLSTTSSTSHDASFFSELKNYREILPLISHSYPISFFKIHFFSLYLIPTLALAATFLWYLKSKQFLKLGFVLISISAFLLISLVVYHSGDSDHGMERTFLPLALFSALPFLKDVLLNPEIGWMRTVRIPFLAIVAAWGFFNIARAGVLFQSRITEIHSYLEQADSRPGNKFIIQAEDINLRPLEVHFFFATETLIYSSLKGPDHSNTIFINESGFLDSTLVADTDDLYLFTDYYPYRSEKDLNPRYFNISGKYIPLYGERKVVSTVFCGAEEIDDENNLIASDGTLFPFVPPREKGVVFEGEYSVKTDANINFALGTTLPESKISDQWRITVKRFGNRESSVVAADGESLYVRGMTPLYVDENGWETLQISFVVTSKVKRDQIKVYVWNPSKENTYFDNFLIEKLTQ